MPRILEQTGGLGKFDDAAYIHDGHVCGYVFYHSQVVADEHIGQIEFLTQVHQQIQDLRLYRYVEGRGGFIANYDLGVHDEGTGNRYALALPARQLTGRAVGVTHGKAHPFEHLDGFSSAFGRRAESMYFKGKRHNRSNAAARIEG